MATDIILDECGGCHLMVDIDELEQCESCEMAYCRDCFTEHTCTEDELDGDTTES